MRPHIRWAAAAAVLGAAACVDRPSLFEPGGEDGATTLRLPAGELALYESDTIRVDLGSEAARELRVQLMLLDSVRTVLWRSSLVALERGGGEVPVGRIPPELPRGAPLLLTGVITDAEGHRFYASDDSAATTLADAAVRSARVYAGRRVRAGGGAVTTDLAVAADLARAYFPLPGESAVGALDLSGDGRFIGTVPGGTRPERVAYRGGVLAVLGAGGGELSVMQVGADAISTPRSALLAPLELELDTTFLGAVRPTGRALALGCAGEGCGSVFAVVPSGLQVVEGTLPQAGSAGVLRVVDASVADGAMPLMPLALPGYTDVLRGDTGIAAAVFSPAAPSGGRQLLQRRAGVSRCLSTALGGARVVAGTDGVVYVAGAAAGQGPPCGPGTAIIRLDDVRSDSARPSVLAIRNTLGEDRLGTVLDLQLSDDGTALLVLNEDGVAVLDPFLRVRGMLALPGVRSVAWRRGAGALRFAVADEGGVTVYDATRLTPLARVPTGPTSGPIVYLHRGAAGDVVAAAIPGGFVVATVPEP